jgi:hypothetical protein
MPAITPAKIRRHKTIESPLDIPLLSIFRDNGRKSIESRTAIAKGAKNGLEKYKPANTRKKKNNTRIALVRAEVSIV